MSKRVMLLWVIPVMVMLIGCASQKTGVYSNLDRKAMEKSFSKYEGTPYKWGGTEPKKGVDCSGFTSGVYRDQGVIIPRTSRLQYTVGDEVSKNQLQYGDLLFFDTLGKGVSHVGVYMGNNKMIHASTSAGVVRADINTDYWKKRYIGARRLTGSKLADGAILGEKHLIPSRYPLLVRRLIDIPSTDVIENHFLGLDIQNNVDGNLRVGLAFSLWNRLEIGSEIQINQFLGYDIEAFGFELPFFHTKLRLWQQHGDIPSLAIGGESMTRKWTRSTTVDSLEIIEQFWSPPKNVYLVASYKYDQIKPTELGRGRISAGVALRDLYSYHDTSSVFDQGKDAFFFVGLEQQITRRFITTVEFDHIGLEDTGITWNMGLHFALNNSSSIAYVWRNIGTDERSLDRAMQFSYILEY